VNFGAARKTLEETLGKSNDPAHMAERLVERATCGERGLRDDTSCIVVLSARRTEAQDLPEIVPEIEPEILKESTGRDEVWETPSTKRALSYDEALANFDNDDDVHGASSLSSSPSGRRSGTSAILRMMPRMTLRRRGSDMSVKAGKFGGMQRNAVSLPYHLDQMMSTVSVSGAHPNNDFTPPSVITWTHALASEIESTEEKTPPSVTKPQMFPLKEGATEQKANATYRAGQLGASYRAGLSRSTSILREVERSKLGGRLRLLAES